MRLSTGSFYCHRSSSKIHYFQTRCRIIRIIVFSWVIPVSFYALKITLYMFYFKTIPVPVPLIWLTIIFEFLPCVLLTLCFPSMIFHARRHDQSARTLAKQLRFNHQMSFKILHDRSAVIMMGLVIGVFLVCYGMHLTWRCVLKKIIKKTKAYHLTCVTHSCSIGCKSLMNECERLEQFSKRLINV